jgi:predicted lipid-binding transport protein (Tim44 family)
MRRRNGSNPSCAAKTRAPRVAFEEGWFGSLNAGVVGGALMMLIAVVWFVGGLFAGILFFYPPILFVIGIIAMVKGMFGGGD